MKKVGATVTSSFLFAEPLITVLFAIILVEETLSSSIILGGFLIFIGVYLVTKK
jgi:drug/metabolite transporter (DMT)-like permease